jgi:DNA-binding XRE family transcriptional regulator
MVKIKKKENYIEIRIVKSGYTITSFAKKIGISKNSMSQIVRGNQYPNPETAKKICDTLKCKFDDIFATEED